MSRLWSGGDRLPRLVALGIAAGLAGGLAAWAQAPQLASVTPANGTTGVAVDSSIVFEFDQPMDTNVPLVTSFPPFLVGNFEVTGVGGFVFFEGTWSADGRTLTCAPSADYSGNTTITWTLNPAGSAVPFTNEEGTEELATVTGSFTTGEGGGGGGGDEDCNGLPDDWGGYSLMKGALYTQVSTADPVPETPDAFYFGANVGSPQSGPEVTAASITLPDNSMRELTGFFGSYFYADSADQESELETAYPAGDYVLRFAQSGEPERVVNMTMPANNVPVPKIQNYAAMQGVDVAQDLTVQWNAFSGAGANDFLSISVMDDELGEVVFQAPDPCEGTELPVTATSVVIPAGTLMDGKVYAASLTFSKTFYASTNAVPNMSGFGGLSRNTSFNISTGSGGGPADPATLSDFQVLGNGNPGFRLTGTASHTYTIERTGELTAASEWATVGTVTTDGSGQAVFEDTEAGKTFPLFYRAVAE